MSAFALELLYYTKSARFKCAFCAILYRKCYNVTQVKSVLCASGGTAGVARLDLISLVSLGSFKL